MTHSYDFISSLIEVQQLKASYSPTLLTCCTSFEDDSVDDGQSVGGCYCHNNRFAAVICNCTLSIFDLVLSTEKSGDKNCGIEVEFDDELVAVTWDVTGFFLVVADRKGFVHLITADGVVLFSKCVQQDTSAATFVNLKFLLVTQSAEAEFEVQTLLISFSDGTLLAVKNLALSEMQQHMIKQRSKDSILHLLQSMCIQKSALPIELGRNILKAQPFIESEVVHMMVLDERQELRVFEIGTPESLNATETRTQTEETSHVSECYDFSIFPFEGTDETMVITSSPSRISLLCPRTLHLRAELHVPFEHLSILNISASFIADVEEIYSLKVLFYCNGTAAPLMILELFYNSSTGKSVLVPSGCSILPVDHQNLFAMNNSYELASMPRCLGVNKTGGAFDILELVDNASHHFANTEQLQLVHNRLIEDSQESVEKLYDSCLSSIQTAASCDEVLMTLFLLLDVPNPPSGFISKAITSVQEAMERLAATTMATQSYPALIENCMLHVFRLKHDFETVSKIQLHSLYADTVGAKGMGDEAMRCALRALLPCNISHSLFHLLRRGCLETAVSLVKRCVRADLSFDEVQSLKLVPLDVSVDEVEKWVREGLLPRVQIGSMWGRFATEDPLRMATEIARVLVLRAKQTEEQLVAPAAALALVQLAMEVSSFVPSSSADYTALIQEMQLLNQNLLMQKALWERWNDKLTLEDVMELELDGLVFDRIDATSEDALLTDLECCVRPLVEEFNGNLDQMLMKWIEETTTTKIVIAHSTQSTASLGDEADCCTLTRLVVVASAIKDKSMLAMMVLKLFQMPVLEDIEHVSRCVDDEEDRKDEKGNELRDEESAANAVVHSIAMEKLSSLALTVLDYVNASTRDALSEAISLLKVKTLAAKYGIVRFDPRDSQQLKAAVAIMAGHGSETNAIPDAYEFAQKWGGSMLDINTVMLRALTQRALNQQLFLSHPTEYEGRLTETLLHIISLSRDFISSASTAGDDRVMNTGCTPLRADIVLHDTISFLLLELEEISDEIDYEPVISGDSHQEREVVKDIEPKKIRAQMLLRAAMIICINSMNSDRSGSGGKVDDHRCAYGSSGNSVLDGSLLSILKRLATLQTRYDLYLSPADLSNRSVCQSMVATLAKCRVNWVIEHHETLESSECAPLDARCRKLCTLLGVCAMYFAHTAMKLLVEASQLEIAMDVARSMIQEKSQLAGNVADNLRGVAGAVSPPIDSFAAETAEKESELLMDAAITLCSIAGKKSNQVQSHQDFSLVPSIAMSRAAANSKDLPQHMLFPVSSFALSRDLLKGSVAACPSAHLGGTLDLLCGADLVLSVYERIEGANGALEAAATASSQSYRSQKSALSNALPATELRALVSEGVFSRDGILMQPGVVTMPLMKYAFCEIARRNPTSGTGNRINLKMQCSNTCAPDLEDLVHVLQRAENHLLAARILFSSWNNSPAKAQMLRSSMLALCRKVLIYRDIDISFSIACMAALPYDTMVKELKAAVPSIQSDFSRLEVVSRVGEELSHLWDEESLLLLFQGLQNNAKWWHILSSLGIKVDLRIFQCTDVKQRESLLQSIIPELLLKGNMNLDMVTEYCRQFDLEPEFAAVTYIEMLLTSPPLSTTDLSWTRNVRSAATRIEEPATLQLLRRVLPRIHSVDYEKIRYVCAWIIDLLSVDEEDSAAENESENDIQLSNRPSATQPTSCGSDATCEFTVDVTEFRKYNGTGAMKEHSDITQDITTYRRYLDVAGYLSGIRFPAHAIANVTKCLAQADSSDSQVSDGNALIGIYLERIPLWQLFSDPWSVIDPLLTHTSDFTARLSPLCLPLNLKRNEFNARKIMALYRRMTQRFVPVTLDTTLSVNLRSEAYIEGKKAAIAGASEAITASISDPLQQINLWRWIYTQERETGDSFSALAALEAAEEIANQIIESYAYRKTKAASGASFAQSVDNKLKEICYDIRVLKCESTIKEFVKAASRPSDCIKNEDIGYYSVALETALLHAIPDPAQLLQLVIETTLAVAWDLQTIGLSSFAVSATNASLMHLPISHKARAFITTAAGITRRIASHSGLVGSADCAGHQQLNMLWDNLINKSLSDLDANSNSNTIDLSSGESKRSINDSQHCYQPTNAELRRREDISLSHRIAVIILSVEDGEQRTKFMQRLDSMMRGKINRPVRRLTARSKFRAAQSLAFLSASQQDEEQSLFHRFLFCLSELQEIRLPCSEESLLNAMGMRIENHCMYRSGHQGDPSSLVRTWLHDEGNHIAAVELARDLLKSTSCFDRSLWFQIIEHMAIHQFYRSLLQTMMMISGSSIFTDISFSMLGKTVIDSLGGQFVNAVDKIHQISELALLRNDASASRCAYDWMRFMVEDVQQRVTMLCEDNDTSEESTKTRVAPASFSRRNVCFLHMWPRLSYRSSDWDELLPEDVLQTALSLSSSITTILPRMAGNVRSQCDATLNKIRSLIHPMAAIVHHIDHAKSSSNEGRSVITATSMKLNHSLHMLFSCTALFDSDGDKEASSTAGRLSDALCELGTALQSLDHELLWYCMEAVAHSYSRSLVNDAIEMFLDAAMGNRQLSVNALLSLCHEKARLLNLSSADCSLNDADIAVGSLGVLLRWIINRILGQRTSAEKLLEAVRAMPSQQKNDLAMLLVTRRDTLGISEEQMKQFSSAIST